MPSKEDFMHSTGLVNDWNVDPSQLGPIYPFVGSEGVLFVLCLAFCATFMIWKLVTENAKYDKRAGDLRQSNKLSEALDSDPLNHRIPGR